MAQPERFVPLPFNGVALNGVLAPSVALLAAQKERIAIAEPKWHCNAECAEGTELWNTKVGKTCGGWVQHVYNKKGPGSNKPEARWEVHSVEEACEVVAIGAKSGTCGGCLPMPSCEAPPDCGDNVNGLKMCRPCFDGEEKWDGQKGKLPRCNSINAAPTRVKDAVPSSSHKSRTTTMLQSSVTTVTLHELASRHTFGDKTSTVLRLVPGGDKRAEFKNGPRNGPRAGPLNEAWFPQGNQCCVSDDDTECKLLVPIGKEAQVDATSRHDPSCSGEECSWNLVMSRCVDNTSKAESKAIAIKEPSSAMGRGKHETAVCVPVWYGDMFEPGVSAFFLDWLAHYKSIGASRVYIYAEGPQPEWLAGAIAKRGPSSLLEVVWVHLDFKLPEDLWYHGQLWTLNDCPKRARADGFPWALSVDVDEMLTFVDPSMSIQTYLDALGSSVGDFDGVLFEANTTPLTRKCGSAEEYACTAMTPPLRGDSHPKHLASTERVFTLGIHHIWAHELSTIDSQREGTGACLSDATGVERRKCAIHFERPATAWIRHFSASSKNGTTGLAAHESITGGEFCASCVVRHHKGAVSQ